jgi:hypothetical protein
MSSWKSIIGPCLLSFVALPSFEAQSGPAQVNYEKAVALLKNIGPGVAAALQTYRYESASLDLIRDNNSVLALRAAKEQPTNGRTDLNDVTSDFAVAQIVTDMLLNVIGDLGAADKFRTARSIFSIQH